MREGFWRHPLFATSDRAALPPPQTWKTPEKGALGIYNLSDIQNREIRRGKKLSLHQIFSSSSDHLHQSIAILSETIIQNPEEAKMLKKIDSRILTFALAIRTLDHGMQDLPIDQRFAFLFELVRETESLKYASWFGVTENMVIDTDSRIARNRERFDRFIGYFEEIQSLYKTRPNILIATRGNRFVDQTAGTFTEYDYYLEHAIRDNLKKLPRKTVKEIARSVPPYLQTGDDPFLAYLNSLHKMRKRFGILADLDITTEGKKFLVESIKAYVIETPTGYTISKPITEIAEELGVLYTSVRDKVADIGKELEKEGKKFVIPKWELGLDNETMQLAHLINKAISELDKPGHRWKYGQYEYIDVKNQVNALLEKMTLQEQSQYGGFVSSERLRSVIRRYMSNEKYAKQYQIPQIPLHKEAALHNILRDDILYLLQKGFSADPERIRDALQLVPNPTTRKKRAYWKKKVAEILQEIEDKKE
jgi:hypothetical protein